jgi:hypothetical protein
VVKNPYFVFILFLHFRPPLTAVVLLALANGDFGFGLRLLHLLKSASRNVTLC